MNNGRQGFDRLAPVYDGLARIVYGKGIVEAQTCFLSHVPPTSHVLILGGGTGWLLSELLRRQPDLAVWYIESSAAMISKAMRKNEGALNVHFIHGTEDDIPEHQFDVVITNFFLDLFSSTTLDKVVRKISRTLKPSAIWMVADFVNAGKWWQVLALHAMYLFFRLTCSIEAASLPPWGLLLIQSGQTNIHRRFFCAGFIESSVYRLNANPENAGNRENPDKS